MYLQFDTNGDGEISTSELREAMKKLLGQQVGHRDIEEIIRDVDLNGDGRVDFEGEKGWMLPVHLLSCESEFQLGGGSRKEDLHALSPDIWSTEQKKEIIP